MHCINLPLLQKPTLTFKRLKSLIYRHVKDLVATCATVGARVNRYIATRKMGGPRLDGAQPQDCGGM